MGRQQWSEDYWKRMDKDTSQKLRTSCPKCGSSKTYYNKQLKVWRCGKCENSWTIKGMSSNISWWRRLFGKR